jgi:hypothetical protein
MNIHPAVLELSHTDGKTDIQSRVNGCKFPPAPKKKLQTTCSRSTTGPLLLTTYPDTVLGIVVVLVFN